MKTIFFDESGFTGNNLMNFDQPYFSYAGIALDEEYASFYCKEIINEFRIQSDEVKFSNLIKYNKGRKAIIKILNEQKNNSNIVAVHKKYSLACKFFEYIFEPVLSQNNRLFYEVGFHKFISNFIYLLFVANSSQDNKILPIFETSIREKNPDQIYELIIPLDEQTDINNPLKSILTFAICHKDTISDEIKMLSDMKDEGKWTLELSTSSLFSLLSYWGKKFENMSVYCDESKPLIIGKSIFDTMVNRKDKLFISLSSKKQLITFNLSQPIQLVNSKECFGVQIADIFAGATSYSLSNRRDEFSEKCLQIISEQFNPNCIFPTVDIINLDNQETFVNALILEELKERSIREENLFDGMVKFIEHANVLFNLKSTDNLLE